MLDGGWAPQLGRWGHSGRERGGSSRAYLLGPMHSLALLGERHGHSPAPGMQPGLLPRLDILSKRCAGVLSSHQGMHSREALRKGLNPGGPVTISFITRLSLEASRVRWADKGGGSPAGTQRPSSIWKALLQVGEGTQPWTPGHGRWL